MKKQQLLKLKTLKSTRTMINAMNRDKCKVKKNVSGYYKREYNTCYTYKHYKFMDSEIEDGILKVGIWERKNLKAAGQEPNFTIFIDKAAEDFVTYDHNMDRWLGGMIFKLPYEEDPAEQYGQYWWCSENSRK